MYLRKISIFKQQQQKNKKHTQKEKVWLLIVAYSNMFLVYMKAVCGLLYIKVRVKISMSTPSSTKEHKHNGLLVLLQTLKCIFFSSAKDVKGASGLN